MKLGRYFNDKEGRAFQVGVQREHRNGTGTCRCESNHHTPRTQGGF